MGLAQARPTQSSHAYDVRNIEQFVKDAYNSAETKSASVGIGISISLDPEQPFSSAKNCSGSLP